MLEATSCGRRQHRVDVKSSSYRRPKVYTWTVRANVVNLIIDIAIIVFQYEYCCCYNGYFLVYQSVSSVFVAGVVVAFVTNFTVVDVNAAVFIVGTGVAVVFADAVTLI